MKVTQFIAPLVALIAAVAQVGPDPFRPLDTRTRCIVLFRECLVLIDQQDADAILEKVADGGQSGRITLLPNPLPAEFSSELKDADSFFKENFKFGPHLHGVFDEILFADLITKENAVMLEVNGKNEIGRVHSIPIRVPELKEAGFEKRDCSQIQFLEIAGKLYWLPFGW